MDKNVTEAVRYFEQAANACNLDAMYWMGCLYEAGDGVDANVETAKEWYKKSKSYSKSSEALQRLEKK